MGFYGCTFVLAPEQTIPELFEYYGMIKDWSGLVRMAFKREKHQQLSNAVYAHLGARFRPYYGMAPIHPERMLSPEEVAEKYAAFQAAHPQSDFSVEEFLAEELHFNLDDDGGASRDYIYQEENEETFEGRFDSFSVESGARMFIGKDGCEYSIIQVKDLDIEKTAAALLPNQLAYMIEFVLEPSGKMIYLTEAETAAERVQALRDYVSALDPECTLVQTQLHD